MPDARLGERVVVVLEGTDEGGMKSEIEKRIGQTGQPVDEIVVLDEPLPLDPRHNSKIDYARMKKRLLSRPH